MPARYRGKVAGAAVGLWVGGPVGAVVGAAMGHAVDHLQGKGTHPGAADEALRRDFARHLLTLLVEVARADGPVDAREVAAIRTVFLERMRLGPAEAAAVRGWLADALGAAGDADGAAAWMRARVGLPERMPVLAALHDVARADGPADPAEEALLVRLADVLGPEEGAFGEAHRRLGLLPGAAPADVRRAFRLLAVRRHPDQAVRLGPEAVARAEQDFRELREAYDRIRAAQEAAC